jgi:branched-chain amino acid aminotransferase
MNKKYKIWMDDRLISWEKAKIHVLTHTLHYGGGAFEGIRFNKTKYGTAVFRVKDHIDRLFYSASCLEMKIPYSKKRIIDSIIKLIKINKLKEGYIRPIVYYGDEHLGVNPKGCRVHVAIAVFPWGAYLGTGQVKAKLSSFIRIHPKSMVSDAKICGHYVNSMLASIEAVKSGYDEAIMLDYKGNVAEGSGENIFIVKKNILITPPFGNILHGITRDSFLEIAKSEKIKISVKNITPRALVSADEAFYSGTAAGIASIKSVDRHKIGKGKTGPVTGKLAEIYRKAVHGEIPKYRKWLTFVK